MSQNVIAAVDDMLFGSKIRAVAEHLGITVKFERNNDAVIDAARASNPSLIIVDLHASNINPIDLSKRLKADNQLREISLLGFFSHVQTELRKQAEEAGFDRLMPRSAFVANLAEILRRG